MYQKLAVFMSAAGMVVVMGCSQSDPGITTAVKTKLATDDTVKAYQIDVDTSDHVVTLSGDVESAAAKEQAVRLARQTDGVRDVVDRLSVSSHPSNAIDESRADAREAGRDVSDASRDAMDDVKDASRDAADRAGDAADKTGAVLTDAALTTAVKSKFLADTRVAGLKIDVDTKDSVVTLTGTVDTKAEGDRAVALARETNGVKRVVDNLKVR